MKSDPRLPGLALRLLERRLPAEDRDWVVGDLCEEYATEVLPRRGPRRARIWLWRQVLLSSFSILRERLLAPGDRPSIHHARKGDPIVQQLVDDARFALRTYRKQPGFTLVAVLTMALGIGATTAVFTVVDGVLLEPLPYPEPDRLMVIWARNLEQNVLADGASPRDFVDWRDGADAFTAMAGWSDASVTLNEGEVPEELDAAVVTPGFLEVLAVEPLLGRSFLPEEGAAGRRDRVVLSHALWARRFASDPAVVGSTVLVNGSPVSVIGVMPAHFAAPQPGIDVWIPGDFGWSHHRSQRYLNVVARLADGVSPAQAQEAMDLVTARLAAEHPESNRGWSARVVPLHADAVAESRPFLLMILGAVTLVLLIACANVANLLLARAASRRREIAVRRALGAGRWRLRRQLVTESLVLGTMGGALGTLLAWRGVPLLLALESGFLPRAAEVAIDARVLLFALGVSIVSSVVVGLAPAGREPTSRPRRPSGERRRQALVVGEMATTLVLLIAAGLLLRSFLELRRVDLGYDTGGLHAARVNLDQSRYPDAAAKSGYFAELRRRIESLPGVDAAAFTSTLPLHPVGSDFDFPYRAEGHPETSKAEAPQADFRLVSPNYLRTMGVPLVAGRHLDERDRRDAALAMVVNETFARQVWPREEAVGKHVTLLYSHAPTFEVVGVVRDTRHRGIASELRPQFFLAYDQTRYPFDEMTIVVKSRRRDAGLADELRRAAHGVDAEEPLYGLTTMEELLGDALARDRLAVSLVAAFALAALVLAATGTYGVLSYQVARRTREIGIRMALGAPRRRVMALVVGEAARLVAVGVLVGVAGALAAARLLEGLLFGVSPGDPVVFVVQAAALAAVALAASCVPALRAAAVEPLVALRQE